MRTSKKAKLRLVSVQPELIRPMPPADLALTGEFRPAPDVTAWLMRALIDPEATMANEDHAHLRSATFGVLWTNVSNSRQMRRIIGTAEQPIFRGTKWSKARQEQQIEEWFGDLPDFLITFDADWASQASDVEWCAVAEHELYHCAQDRDLYGMPKFRQDGSPSFAMRGHDVEEFVGIVRRYGAVSSEVRAMVEAAQQNPAVADFDVRRSCGACMRSAA
jgi:putative metallopeptidase